MPLALIPEPHRLRQERGRFTVPRPLSIGISSEALLPAAETVRDLFGRATIAIAADKVNDPCVLLLRKGLAPEGYRLRINARGIRLEAESTTGAAHGVRTLAQIVQQSGAQRLPRVSITDWPDFAVRGQYYDLCRGRVPTLERLKEQVDLLAFYKMNQLQLYIEHTFRFRQYPEIGRGASPLSAEDVMALDDYAARRHVELVPSLASFGHLASVLRHERFRDLAEDWGVGKYVDPAVDQHRCIRGWTVSPANPKIYPFLDSLFAEFLPCFRSKRFNICCDETWDLGQSYELCQKKGKGRVYLDHVAKVSRLAKQYGKTVMFWGDIIRNHPELIKHIPKRLTVLDWDYSHARDFEAIRDFKKAGLEFYACPGTSSWVSLFPRLPEAMANISGFAAAGKKHGATGLLNTDWGDGGHYNFMEFSWHGYLFAAEQAWNTRASAETFTRRFCRLFLEVDRPDLTRALTDLGDVAQLSCSGYYQSIWLHIFFARPDEPIFDGQVRDAVLSREGRIHKKRMRLTAKVGRDARHKLVRIRRVLVRYDKQKETDSHGVLPYWIFAVDTLIHAARKLAAFGPGGRDTPAARKQLKKELRSLQRRFEKLWLARNRKSEIRITLKKYRRALEAL